MSIQVRTLLASGFDRVRFEPTAKRIRAVLGVSPFWTARGRCLSGNRAASCHRMPFRWTTCAAGWFRRPAAAEATDDTGFRMPAVYSRPVLDPSVPFAVHTAEGQVVDLLMGGQSRPGAGYCPADADLDGYVILDFSALDSWYEEDEVNVAHPRDPFHRIDVLASSRHVSLVLNGQVLADSSRPILLFETMLPTRYYMPREDVQAELIPSGTRTSRL